jgi:hypothetical protein
MPTNSILHLPPRRPPQVSLRGAEGDEAISFHCHSRIIKYVIPAKVPPMDGIPPKAVTGIQYNQYK